MPQYSLSILCHFVALADCIRFGYVGGQLVITRNISSFSFFTISHFVRDFPTDNVAFLLGTLIL